MRKLGCRLTSLLAAAQKAYGIGSSAALVVILLPFIVIVAFCVILLIPPTRQVALLILKNKGLLDVMTVALLMVCGVMGVRLAFRIRKYGAGHLTFWFFLLISAGILSMGIAEITWSTRSARVEIPHEARKKDAQGQVRKHELRGLQNSLEVLPLSYGLAGLLGIWVSRRRCLKIPHVPDVLTTWFFVIAVISAIDLSYDFHSRLPKVDRLVGELEEAVEMLVAISALLFIWLNSRMLSLRQ